VGRVSDGGVNVVSDLAFVIVLAGATFLIWALAFWAGHELGKMNGAIDARKDEQEFLKHLEEISEGKHKGVSDYD